MERSSSQAYSLHPTKAVDGVLKLLGSEAKAKPYRDRRCFDEKGLSASLSLSTRAEESHHIFIKHSHADEQPITAHDDTAWCVPL